MRDTSDTRGTAMRLSLSLTVMLIVVSVSTLSAGPFRAADSLALAGRLTASESLLLSILRQGSAPEDQVLFRLAGLYHGSGRESEFLGLLDSLESAGYRDLHGWRISILDLSRMTGQASALVPPDEPLLQLWLSRDEENPVLPSILPAPATLAERTVRAMYCQDGRMSKGQVEQTARDALFIPFLADQVLTELEIGMKNEGPWWDEVASQLSRYHSGERLQLLLGEREIHLSRIYPDIWEERLGMGGQLAARAAMVLLELDPQRWSVSWRVTDALVSGGMVQQAESLASISSDGSFASGVSMAVLRERGMNRQLLELCDSLSPDAADSLLARGALFRARAQRGLGLPASIYYASYMAFASGYPDHPLASEAAYLAGRYYDSERNWPMAADAYLAALRAGDFGQARACWRGGLCHYMCGRGAVGDSIWAAGIQRYPYSSWCDEMLFWRARYAGRQDDTQLQSTLLAETVSRHPWEFYGLLASDRTGIRTPPFPMSEKDLSQDPVTAEAVTMMSSGYGTLAAEMLYGTTASDEGSRAIALALMGEHQRSLEVLRGLDYRLRDSGTGILPDSLLLYYYPAPYREVTEESIQGLAVTLEIVTGLMRQESYFNRWARSWVGATGLIQLMPGTAGDIARWYDLPVLSGDDFYIPEKSILYGSVYLSRQFSSFDGSEMLALSAYNAGPGNASRWMDDFPPEDGDPELFIEQIPLTETRNYVKNVMANAWIYGRIFR